VRPFPKISSRANSSATKRAHLPARSAARPENSNTPTRARSSSTKSGR
jgi:hypothetical protein